nr:unnamed protein product [Digitaria exilis]
MALLLLPFFLLLLSSPSVQAQQNITLGSSLTPQSSTSSWLSPSGDFAFGFRPIEGNTSSYLLAVWFNKISSMTVVWYAKTTEEDGSVVQVSSSSRLQLTSSGALSLQDPIGTEVLNPGMKLRSRIISTDYSNGRFLLDLQTDGAFFYPVAVPSGYQYDSYWSVPGNDTTNLVFNVSGMIYITSGNGTQIKITSGVITSIEDYYQRATLDPDGVFRQYVYPKKKKMPLSNGIIGDGVQRTVFIKVPKNKGQQSELIDSSTWKKDKKKKVPTLQSPSSLVLPLKSFTYAELEKATSRFQEVLGTGGPDHETYNAKSDTDA